ncbi:DUF5993 family protein [Burkholderia cenocepacia]
MSIPFIFAFLALSLIETGHRRVGMTMWAAALLASVVIFIRLS